MIGLTKRQSAILGFIVEQIAAKGWPPSIREIGDHFGMSSSNAVADHLRALEKKGYLRREPGISRGIRVLQTESKESTSPNHEID